MQLLAFCRMYVNMAETEENTVEVRRVNHRKMADMEEKSVEMVRDMRRKTRCMKVEMKKVKAEACRCLAREREKVKHEFHLIKIQTSVADI